MEPQGFQNLPTIAHFFRLAFPSDGGFTAPDESVDRILQLQ
jgi:hypothetical protein